MTSGPAVTILGGGIAGLRFAETLARADVGHRITVLSDDEVLGCNRPLLSKGALVGTVDASELVAAGRNRDGYRVREARAISIDLEARCVHVALGEPEPFDTLVVATGLLPRRASLAGIPELTISRLRDSEALRRRVAEGARVGVVGSGALALETASSLASLGTAVVLVTRSSVPLAHELGATMSARIAEAICASRVVWRIGGDTTSMLHDVDVVVSAIGAEPDHALLGALVAPGERGIRVDDRFRATRDPCVIAVGDVAVWPDGRAHPHWFSAMEAARRGTQGLLGGETTGRFVHSWWSDQWGLRVQCFGEGCSPGTREQILDDTREALSVAYVDGTGVVQGVASLAPAGRPSPALALRGLIGTSSAGFPGD